MILHLLRMRRNVNRNVFNDRKNVSATTSFNLPVVPSSLAMHKSQSKHIDDCTYVYEYIQTDNETIPLEII